MKKILKSEGIIFPERRHMVFCLSESLVPRNVKHFLVKREKSGATERIARMIFLSRRMAFVKKQDLSRHDPIHTSPSEVCFLNVT